MTDRYAGFVVTLAQNLREDDAAATITALRQIKGVISVEPIPGDVELASKTMLVKARVRAELFEFAEKLFADKST